MYPHLKPLSAFVLVCHYAISVSSAKACAITMYGVEGGTGKRASSGLRAYYLESVQ